MVEMSTLKFGLILFGVFMAGGLFGVMLLALVSANRR